MKISSDCLQASLARVTRVHVLISYRVRDTRQCHVSTLNMHVAEGFASEPSSQQAGSREPRVVPHRQAAAVLHLLVWGTIGLSTHSCPDGGEIHSRKHTPTKDCYLTRHKVSSSTPRLDRFRVRPSLGEARFFETCRPSGPLLFRGQASNLVSTPPSLVGSVSSPSSSVEEEAPSCSVLEFSMSAA